MCHDQSFLGSDVFKPILHLTLKIFLRGFDRERNQAENPLQLACEELQKGNLFFIYGRLNISDKPAKTQLKENGLQMYISLISFYFEAIYEAWFKDSVSA